MEYYQNILCVTYDDLQQFMPYDTIRKMVTRGNCEVVRRGYGRDTYALISWSSLPRKVQERWVQLLGGDPASLLKAEESQRLREQRHDAEAVAWFSQFRYVGPGGERRALSPAQREVYVMNATALKLLLAEHNRRVLLTKASNNSRSDLWSILAKSSEALRKDYPHTLPKSVKSLREKVLQYKSEGMSCVISGKLANKNTSKISAEGAAYLIALRRCKVPMLSMDEILVRYNERAMSEGWKVLKSVSTLNKWFDKGEIKVKWWDAVYGEQKAHQKFDRKHSTELPLLANTLWYGDGTKLNLYYRDDDGKVRTIMVYEVMDAASECLIGYHISESEDYEAQYFAYRMAVERAGVKPMEIVYDNQGGHKKLAAQSFFSKLALRHRPTAPYNGSSKTIENAFYRFQREVLSKHWHFTGQNVTAKMDMSKPNIEFIEANRANLPTLSELKRQYCQLREAWNDMQHAKYGMSRAQVFDTQCDPKCPMVTEWDMMDMFWFVTQRPSTYTANGIRVTLKGREHLFEVYESAGVPDYRWTAEHVDVKFYVQYDPMDLQSVRLLDVKDQRLVAVAETKMVVHRSSVEQDDTERQFIRESREAIQRERARRVAEGRVLEVEHGVAPEQHGLNSPKLKNLPKELEEQLEKRVARARRKKLEAEGLGQYTKVMSLQDWLALRYDDELEQKIRSKY